MKFVAVSSPGQALGRQMYLHCCHTTVQPGNLQVSIFDFVSFLFYICSIPYGDFI